MPRLILEARRIAATVIHGLHGRRRAGPGENFWQYRRFLSGEPARRVDWRRSARDEHLYVREREWEAAHTVWLWPDRSPSMVFRSQLARESKLDRTPGRRLRARRSAGAGRRARRHAGPDAADRQPQRARQDGERDRARCDRARRACRRRSRRRRSPRSWWCRISGARWRRCARPSRNSRRPARTATSCRSSIRPKRPFPIPAASSSSSRKAPAPSPPAAPRPGRREYETRVARHRAEIRAETDKLGWSFTIHRTDRPATELLLALHARLGAPPPGAAVSGRVSAARQPGGAHDAGLPLGFAQPLVLLGLLEPAGAVVAAAAHSAAAAPHRLSRRRGCCSTSRRGRRRRGARRGGSRCCA